MAFPIETIANAKIQFQNIMLLDILELAKLNPFHYEKQITQILSTALKSSEKEASHLTVQERYTYFLRYLQAVDYNSLDEIVTASDFHAENYSEFNRERQFDEETGVSVRHLRGMDVEALEIGCEKTIDWIIGAMAITIGAPKYKGLEPLDDEFTLNYTANVIANRINILNKLSDIEFNELMDTYLKVSNSMQTLVKFSFNKGIVLDRFKGGAEDAPVRFRPNTVLFGHGKRVYEIAISGESE